MARHRSLDGPDFEPACISAGHAREPKMAETAMVGAPLLTGAKVVETIKRLGITHVIYLADFMQGFILQGLLTAHPEITLVTVCREGEAIPLAAGLWMTGNKPLIMHQNAGLLEAGDAIASVGIDLSIPILMMIGYRGYRRSRSTAMTDPPGQYVEPLLRALDVPYEILENDEDIPKLEAMDRLAQQTRRPTAALVAWDATW